PGPYAPGPPAPGPYAPGPQAPGSHAPGPQAPGSYAPGPQGPGSHAPGPLAPGSYAPGQQAPSSYAPGPYAPGPPGAAPALEEAPRVVVIGGESHPGFWPRLPTAFLVPFRGGAAQLVFGVAAITTAGFVALGLLPAIGFLAFAKLVLSFAFGTAAVGAHAHVFTRFALAGMHDEGGAPPEVSPAWPSFSTLYYRGLSLVGLLILLFGAFAWLAVQGTSPLVLVVGMALVYVYWPMALSVQALTGRPLAPFEPPTVVRGIFAAPVEYAIIVIMGVAVLVAASALTFFIAGGALLGAVAAQSFGAAMMALLIGQGIGVLAGTVLAAVQGYLMGCLVGARPDRFGFL
ncbi:MAG: hypothetical protein AAGH15_26155, partial [Myxococcota bacterium]